MFPRTVEGIKIGERRQYKLPSLEQETMQRIQHGIDRFFKQPQIPALRARDVPEIDGVAPFWITYYSNGKAYSIYEPLCTFSTVARCAIVFPSTSGSLDIQECTFRMLNSTEIMAGSGLRDGQMISTEEAKAAPTTDGYEIVADTKEELIRQCGHMVPPPMAQWVTQQAIRAI